MWWMFGCVFFVAPLNWWGKKYRRSAQIGSALEFLMVLFELLSSNVSGISCQLSPILRTWLCKVGYFLAVSRSDIK